jgi:myosin heavy subunit
MKFTHIHLQNFCKHRNFESNLYDSTLIEGCNEVGKSTIKRAIYWILNLKDENGKEITGIRPHDKDGKDIDDVVTEVELTLDSGIILRKSHYQKRNKKGEITGNQTDCYVNGIPKQSGEYAKYLLELIPSDLCINAQTFIRLDTAKRRALLEETFGRRTTDEIVDRYPEFEPIREMLKIGTIAELKKRCNVAIKGDKNHKGLEQLRDEIPARIDEIEKQKVDIDVAELELARNVLKEQLAENRTKQDDLSKQMEEVDKISSEILELKFEVNDLIRQANDENYKAKADIKDKVADNEFLMQKKKCEIREEEESLFASESRITESEKIIEECREEYKRVSNLEFDDSGLVCPYCGQEYQDDKKEQIKAEFEAKKQKELSEIEERGKAMKERVKAEKEAKEKHLNCISQLSEEIDEILNTLSVLQDNLEKLPEPKTDENPEIQNLKQQIAKKEQELSKNKSISEIRQNLELSENDIQQQLLEVEVQLSKSANNVAIDERIDELHEEQRELSQKIADQERTLNYLKEFDRKKQELLTSDVNEFFDYASVKMFGPMFNGEMKDVCQLIVDGEPYDRNLNFGSKMLVEIDICRAFQRKLGVSLPIILDEASSLDPWRVPEMGNQIIMIRRSDNEKLTVSEV